MRPQSWIEHRRGSDKELLGWIRPEGEDWIAVSLLGHDITGPVDWLAAEEALEDRGLTWLGEVWTWEVNGDLLRVRFVEVSAAKIIVQTDDYGAIDVPVTRYELPWPAPEGLRPLHKE